MTITLDQALENIYTSLHNANKDIDTHIAELKAVLKAAGQTSVVVDETRLAENNRPGRKLMQSYFRKRGVTVTFAKDTA